MRSTLSILALLTTLIAFSQPPKAATSADCLANWHNKEEKVYLIQKKKTVQSGSKPATPNIFTYEIHLEVIDSSAKGYTIAWTNQLTEDFKKAFPGVADSLPAFNGLKMILHCSPEGAFQSLENWQDVRDAYVKMLMYSVPNRKDSLLTAMLDKTLAMFSTQKAVEGILIAEVQTFFYPFGYQFSTTPITVATTIASPVSADSIPAKQTVQAVEINRQKDYFSLRISDAIDKAGARNFIMSFFKTLGLSDKLSPEEFKQLLDQLDISYTRNFSITQSTGWPKAIEFVKTVSIGGISNNAETITIKEQ